MSFSVLFSDKVELLCDRLIASMGEPLPDPLAVEYVLVDNIVMGQWINLQLAQKKKIAANIRYIQPHELFWLLARALVSQSIPQETPLSKEEMTWKLYSLMGDQAMATWEGMQPVMHYLQGDDCHDLKRYQLAAAIADLFDQYLVYRPDMMLHWEGREPSSDSLRHNERWQRQLWRKLTLTAANTGLHHRAAIEKQLLSCLHTTDSSTVQKKIPLQRLFVFGITSMPPKLVEMLLLLGEHIHVQLLAINPCQEFWTQISSARELASRTQTNLDELHFEIGNPLLASQGVQLRDFINLLQERTDEQEFLLSEDGTADTLLTAIQQEIRDLRYKGESANVDYVSNGDRQPLPSEEKNTAEKIPSIHVHNCHSLMREVEVLHDQLRDMLRCNPDMHPRDIVVMMPRVAPYVACIHAVFNSVPEQHRIAYHITDRTMLEESPLLNSFDVLLRLPDSRLPLSEVVSLLEVPAIQRRFGLDQNGYETVKRWLVEAGVHWGADAKHREAVGLPAYGESSWDFGFHRLLSGYAIATDKNTTEDILTLPDGMTVLPYDDVEGGNSVHLNALLQFWDTLQHWRKLLAMPATPPAWATRIRELVEQFFLADDEKEQAAIQAILSAIRVLDDAGERGWFLDDIALPVIRGLLQPALAKPAMGQHQWREGVKFCSLLPMRGVPFRAVYIMGMNLEDYPRRIERRSFDLMRNQHRCGDRASRIDDRWLFLEALLSARQYFHVSYIGRDMHRNEKREPSVVLSELLDYCRHGYDLPEGFLVTEHALQPFSESYFRKDKKNLSPRLLSFSEEARLIAVARQQGAHKDVDGDVRWQRKVDMETEERVVVDINDFIRFFTRPWDWFFSRKHKLWLDIEDDGVDDAENFGDAADGALHDWQVYSDLIRMANAVPDMPTDLDAARDELVHALARVRMAEGRWPLGRAGQEKIRKFTEIKPDYLWASHGQTMVMQHLAITIGAGKKVMTIEGDWPLTAAGVFMMHSASKLDAVKQLDFDIRLALLRAQYTTGVNVQEGKAQFRDKVRCVPLEYIDTRANRAFLNTLASLYLDYRACGLPFDFSLGHAMLDIDDVDALHEWFDDRWHENIASDNKKRTYFCHVSTVKSRHFQAVTTQFWQALHAWLAPIDTCIKARQDAEKIEKAASKGKRS